MCIGLTNVLTCCGLLKLPYKKCCYCVPLRCGVISLALFYLIVDGVILATYAERMSYMTKVKQQVDAKKKDMEKGMRKAGETVGNPRFLKGADPSTHEAAEKVAEVGNKVLTGVKTGLQFDKKERDRDREREKDKDKRQTTKRKENSNSSISSKQEHTDIPDRGLGEGEFNGVNQSDASNQINLVVNVHNNSFVEVEKLSMANTEVSVSNTKNGSVTSPEKVMWINAHTDPPSSILFDPSEGIQSNPEIFAATSEGNFQIGSQINNEPSSQTKFVLFFQTDTGPSSQTKTKRSSQTNVGSFSQTNTVPSSQKDTRTSSQTETGPFLQTDTGPSSQTDPGPDSQTNTGNDLIKGLDTKTNTGPETNIGYELVTTNEPDPDISNAPGFAISTRRDSAESTVRDSEIAGIAEMANIDINQEVYTVKLINNSSISQKRDKRAPNQPLHPLNQLHPKYDNEKENPEDMPGKKTIKKIFGLEMENMILAIIWWGVAWYLLFCVLCNCKFMACFWIVAMLIRCVEVVVHAVTIGMTCWWLKHCARLVYPNVMSIVVFITIPYSILVVSSWIITRKKSHQ